MIKVVAKPGEPADSLIRKFGRKVASEGILTDLKKREFYRKPSERRKEEREERERKIKRGPRS
ncbi:30S ribosomal protein S21 [Candidatus Microgenomates bacterium]|nr:30S ribosomal protein S21 [Candidatus Microgenomates bacterium]